MRKKKKKAWNKHYNFVKMALWNPWGLSNERLNYCRAMNYDILGLPELHNAHNSKKWRGKHWITSEDAETDEQGQNLDPASGVGIMLSQRFAKKILAKGAVGSRIVWVRLDGPVCPLFVVCAYVPHKFKKTAPVAQGVINQIDELLTNCKHLKSTDCVILLGDFNCELQRNVKGCTGRWLMNKRPDDGHSEQVMDLIRSHDLFAIDSLFRPKRKKMFDGKKRVCNATYLQKDTTRRPKKLDYFFVSNRWKSCVINSATDWAPSEHRFGKHFDHSLLKIKWKWRVKSERSTPTKDFKAMTGMQWRQLDDEFKAAMEKSKTPATTDTNANIDESLTRMNSCLRQAIEATVPNKKRLSTIKRATSEKTRSLYVARTRKFSAIVAQGGKVSKQLRKRWHRKLRDASLRDYNDWLSLMATKMEEADKKGDSETIFRIVKIMSGLMMASSNTAPSTNKQGELILDHKQLAKTWNEFLTDKFKATEAETKLRDPYEKLGPQLVDDPLTEQAFVRALQKLKKGKACGPDGIPGEVFTNSESAARELYRILKMIWQHEYVPPELVRASFVMLFKNKGSVNDPKKYRCIGLLPHAYKILSLIMLERINKECSHFLSEWQAGFRPERGCRDNILLLRVLFDQALGQGEDLVITFIDYTAAFDSVSHKFLDQCLKKAKASRKTRALFRAIYAAAEGTARVQGLDGKHIYSEEFKIRRGVIQGDIISPIFFILALEQVFRICDENPRSVQVGNYLQIGVLGYADDAALAAGSTATKTSMATMSERISAVSSGSRNEADMHLHSTKNSSQLQIPVSPQTPNLQSPIILGHCNDSINNNINWSPTILGHHRHSHTQHTNANDTLLPPIHMMDMFEYLDHISSAHENIKNLSDSSF